MTNRTLTVELKLYSDDVFEINVMDDESGMSRSFTQDTKDIEEKLGVEIMSWLDMMEVEEE